MTRFSELFADRPVLADGAMGTVLYARGIFVNRCYDELNLSDPNLILGVHEEYLQAGAEILETNTFGANRFRLARHGLAGKMAEINAAGVRLARQAVQGLKEKHAGNAEIAAWVAGAWSRWAKPDWMKRARHLPSRSAFWLKTVWTC